MMDSKWTAGRDAESVNILIDDPTLNTHAVCQFYHVREKIDFIVVVGVRRVRWKHDQRILLWNTTLIFK